MKINESIGSTTMKTKKMTLMFAVLVMGLMFSVQLFAQMEGEMVKAFSNPSGKKIVEVTWRNGDVVIRGYDGDEVRVIPEDGHRRSREAADKARGLRKIYDGDAINVEESNNVITVSSHSTFNSVDVEVMVPRDVELSARNVLNGDLTIENFGGELEITTLNGELLLKNISGPVVAHSVNGEIIAELTSVTGDNPMSFSTVNSDIDIALPPDVKATLEMSTSDEIYTDFDMEGPDTMTTTSVRDRRRSSKKLYGINGGGTIIEIGTVHGSIYIRQLK